MLKKHKHKPNPLKVSTRSAVRKGPLKDKAHRQRVATLPCVICEAVSYPDWPNEAHHIRECFPRTMGRRIGDENVIPLCLSHHVALHKRSRTWWTDSGIDPVPIAAALYAETLAGRSTP